ncbi:MAG: DNA repair exonuclease [Candidatus Tectomicrobia bacterium]|nr:DNA repair exonuclease [Candidatus Tectomicrobia bacterium]
MVERKSSTLKVLHTADVHLDPDAMNGTQRAQVRSLYRDRFGMIIDKAMRHNIDLFLIAGDLFDSNRASQGTIDFVVEQLNRLDCPTVILPGNHDCLNYNPIYERVDFEAACSNVRVITDPQGTLLKFPELNIVLWGRAMIEHAPTFRPLGGLPPRQDGQWHIALAHGLFLADGMETYRSSPILPAEIRDSGWDYVALGHHHAFTDVSQGEVTAYYPSAPVNLWTPSAHQGYVLLLSLDSEQGIQVIPEQVSPNHE